jgi:hypothetical protein
MMRERTTTATQNTCGMRNTGTLAVPREVSGHETEALLPKCIIKFIINFKIDKRIVQYGD